MRVFAGPSRPCVSLLIIIIDVLALLRPLLKGLKEKWEKLHLMLRAAAWRRGGGGAAAFAPSRRGPRGAPRQCLVFAASRLEHLTHILVL